MEFEERIPRQPKTFEEKETQKRLIVLLDSCNLETIKNGQVCILVYIL